jgi:hypothetical protein
MSVQRMQDPVTNSAIISALPANDPSGYAHANSDPCIWRIVCGMRCIRPRWRSQGEAVQPALRTIGDL